MAMYGITEPEANTLITQGVDFAITQVVDGNWGVHSVIPKAMFDPIDEAMMEPVGVDAAAQSRMANSEEKVVLPLNAANVHWGYFSKEIDPVLTVSSGDEVIVEMATHHACDDWDKMVAGDEGK